MSHPPTVENPEHLTVCVLERACVATLHRALAHDFNGKLMGVQGIVDFWKDAPQDPDQLRQDLQLITQSLYPLQHVIHFLAGLEKRLKEDAQTWRANDVQHLLTNVLSLFFKPQSSFKLTIDPAFALIAIPSRFFTHLGILCYISQTLRQSPQNLITLNLASSTHGQTLQLSLECKEVPHWAHTTHPQWTYYLKRLEQEKAQLTFQDNSLQLSVPMDLQP